MQKKILTKHYADAFMRFAGSFPAPAVGAAKAYEEVRDLKALMDSNPDFSFFLKSRRITLLEKLEFLDKVLDGNFTEPIRLFLRLLLERNRFDLLEDICEEIRTAYSDGRRIDVLIKTAFLLDLEEIKEIERRLEQKFAKPFKYFIELDPNLLGGVQVMIGNRIIDASVRRRIKDLRDEMLTGELSNGNKTR
jgi:F-type H+-transporting ATPase subunit delta